MVIKSLTFTAPVNAAEVPLVMVRLLMFTDVPVIAPPVPASSPRSKAPVMPEPKIIFAPPTEPFVVATVELAVSVTPPGPFPKLMSSPELLIAPPNLLAALPEKFKPPSNKKVSPPSPRVTLTVLRKLVLVVIVFVAPVNAIL